MKITSLAIFAALILSISAQYYPLPYSDYNSANALLTYLLGHNQYYLPQAPNSIFFQFAWYITQDEVQAILHRMDSIYNKYGLNGVFLILDDKAGINNIEQYSVDLIQGLDQGWELFYTENIYLIVLQYTYVPAAWPNSEWVLKFAISCGDKADAYLPDSSRRQIMDTYGQTLKYYTNKNMIALIDDIEYAMEQNSHVSWVVIVIVVFAVLCCGGGGAYYGKRRYDNRSGNSGIHVTSAQY